MFSKYKEVIDENETSMDDDDSGVGRIGRQGRGDQELRVDQRER